MVHPPQLRLLFQTTLTLTTTIAADSYCYVTKNKGLLGDKKDKKVGVLGGKPLIGPLFGQKATPQCGKARAIETSSIRGLEAADKLLIRPSAAARPDAASSPVVGDFNFRPPFAFLRGLP